MRFHDFHLSGYSVRKFGGEVVLHLIYDYPAQPPEESHIRFGDVEFYHFVHTGGAIILDIAEISLSDLLVVSGIGCQSGIGSTASHVGTTIAQNIRRHLSRIPCELGRLPLLLASPAWSSQRRFRTSHLTITNRLTNRSSQPLAVPMSSFQMTSTPTLQFTLASASGG
jgi:hypothetical protein